MYKLKNKHIKIAVVVCILLVAVTSMGVARPTDDEKKKIYKNIYIEDINIGELTKEAARKIIQENFKEDSITINYANNSWTIYPRDIGLLYNVDEAIEKAYKYTHSEDNILNIKRSMKLRTKENYIINLTTQYDEVKLCNKINEICKEINVKEKNASIEIKDSGEIVRSESKEGIEVEAIKLKEQIYDMITSHNIETIDLPAKIIKPTLTTDDVKSINTVLGQHSTSFNEYSSRGSNIHVAALSTSDKILMPQEVFSYNQATGYRSWSNGYKTAKVIVGGKYVNGEGGGVCQVSTTIYNASLLAGMQIEEVHNHTIQSHYSPRGRDAAVSYGYTDLKFKNGYSHPIYIKNIVSNGIITSKIYGCDEDREKLYIRTEEKFNKDKIYVKTYRVYLDEENNKIRDELIANSIYKNH